MICWPGPRLVRLPPLTRLGGAAMELFTQLFGDVLAFVYHCFDRIVIYGYLSGLSRPEQVVHFFRDVVGVAAVSKEVLSQRTADYHLRPPRNRWFCRLTAGGNRIRTIGTALTKGSLGCCRTEMPDR